MAPQRLDTALAAIQPLRDLSRNWDVDIASFLQDYLQDIVGQMNHSRDDDDLNESIASSTHHIQSDKEVLLPNFAEAALLLQNSSHVYSRKVEYLYSLVYSALDDLASSSTNAPNKQKSKRHVDDDIQDFESFDPQLQFLLLDDVLPTDESGDKINLKQPVNDNAFDADRTLPHQSMTRLSMGGMSTTKLDKSGIAPDTALRTLLGALHTQGSESSSGGTLRILSQNSDIGPDGGLHMPGTAILSQTRQSSFGLAPGTPTSVQAPTHDIDAENDDLDASDEMDHHDDDDNDDDGVGFQMADDEPLEPPLPIPPPEPIVAPTRKDPWALLDPHKPDKKGRRLRVGKTHVLPNGIDETPSECVTGARTRRKPVVRRQVERPSVDGKPVSLAAATFKATMARERRKLSRVGLSSPGNDENDEDGGENIPVPNVPMTGLVFGEEFAYIAKAAAKRKAAERRERRKLLAQNPEAVPAEEANELMGYDDGAANFGYGNDDYGGGDDHAFDEPDVVSLEQVLAQNSDNNSNPDAAAFEALCRAHIKAFAKGAERYKTETNLSKRVGDWQGRLRPLLEAEEVRPEFDIHRYSQHVIDKVTAEALTRKRKLTESPQKRTVVDFASVTRNCERYEVCRLFLASLSLSNSGNIKFVGDGRESLTIQLVSDEINRPMETYLAPSAEEARCS